MPYWNCNLTNCLLGKSNDLANNNSHSSYHNYSVSIIQLCRENQTVALFKKMLI